MIISLIFACSKDNIVENKSLVVETKQNIINRKNDLGLRDRGTSVLLEPNYLMYGDVTYDLLSKHIGFVNGYELMPEVYRDQFSTEFKNLMSKYLADGSSFEIMLNDFESEGSISTELKAYYLDLFDGINSTLNREPTNIINFLNLGFQEVGTSNLNYDDRVKVKSFIETSKNVYKYLLENQEDIIYRDEDPCPPDWITIAWYTSVGASAGAKLGSFLGGGPWGTAIGAAIGAALGYEAGRAISKVHEESCRDCLGATGLSSQITEDCGGEADFIPSGYGSNVFEITWTAINGNPSSGTITPTESFRVAQVSSTEDLIIEICTQCKETEFDPLKPNNTNTFLSVHCQTFTYDLIGDETGVSWTDLIITGISKIELPEPNSNNYNDYNYSETETYYFSGPAVWNSQKYSLSIGSNVENGSIVSSTPNSVTINWKVSNTSWNEYLNGGSVDGKANITVQNLCPGGDSRTFPIYSLIGYDF